VPIPKADVSTSTWLSRQRAPLALLFVVYGGILALLIAVGRRSDWLNVTTAYLLAANLIVLWWYADTTKLLLDSSRQQARVGSDQLQETIRASRISHKPFVVVERVQKDDGWFHYFIRNIGPGLAVNVWLVEAAIDGRPRSQTLGPLGPGDSRILYGAIESSLRSEDGVFSLALIAEGVPGRTAQWTATANVRERLKGTEMRNQLLPLRQTEHSRTIEQLLVDEWEVFRDELHRARAGM
jgi:hypothetical protein